MGLADDSVVEATTVERLSVGQLASFTDCAETIRTELYPNDAVYTSAWMLARYSSRQRTFPKQLLVAYADVERTTVVGLGYVELDRTGQNDDAVHANVQVHPAYRRGGIGTALAGRAAEVGRADRRSTLYAWGHRTQPMLAFWQSLGATEAFGSQASRLPLAAVNHELIENWIAAAQPARDRGYELHFWQGRCPQNLLERYAVALCGMADAPHGDLDLEPEGHTPATIREHEKRWLDVGSTPWAMLIIAPDGSAAAMTEVIVHGDRPSELHQESTTTVAVHRRQGLGRWIKAAMIRQLIGADLGADFIVTGNADSNQAMLAINTDLGFEYHSSFVGLQAEISGLGIQGPGS